MIHIAAAPVAAGQHFQELLVRGRNPDVLDDFFGKMAFTARRSAEDRVITGCEQRVADTGTFTEKDSNRAGQYVRVSCIEPVTQPGQFTAFGTP